MSSVKTTAPDPFDLERFVSAQRGSFETALSELKNGRKRSHWMWYIFPQVAGLGTSHMATKYAIQSRAEAVAYLKHPVLGPRLLECTEALLKVEGRTALEVMGTPDDMKLKSSMTLFAAVAEKGAPFQAVLEKYYSGEADPKTVRFLAADIAN